MKLNKFYPKLDSLRAIAVILVIISHWFSSQHFINRYTSNGTIGVTLFFVLSGFLITGILINYKVQLAKKKRGFINALKVFYWRRTLRIFPIYYLLLSIVILFKLAAIHDAFWWHFVYASNFYFWIQGSFQGPFSHFWSLAIEEQFYLIWPLLILIVPIRRYMILFLTAILTAFLFRLMSITESNEMSRFLLLGSIDSFAIGALFALVHKGILTIPNKWKEVRMQSQLGIGFFIVSQSLMYLPLSRNWYLAVYLCLLSCSFGWMILAACRKNEATTNPNLLNNRILIYLGKISYGLYLYHNFIPCFYGLNLSWIPAEFSLYVVQFIRFSVLLFVASVSWYFIEKPMLKLKNSFTIDNL